MECSQGFQSLNRPLWKNQYCKLLNDDFSFFRRAMIQVCLPNEACDHGVLGDSNVEVMFVSDNEALQMTTMRLRLSHTRLEGGRLLSEIITLCSEATQMNESYDDRLQGVSKNPNRLVRRKVIPKDCKSQSKLQMKTLETDICKVSSQKCYKLRCCQTFPWEDTRTLRQKFFACTFETRREMAYVVQTQLHTSVILGKKFVTLANTDDCENAWYIIVAT